MSEKGFSILDRIEGSAHTHMIGVPDLYILANEARGKVCMVTAKHSTGQYNDKIEISVTYHPYPKRDDDDAA